MSSVDINKNINVLTENSNEQYIKTENKRIGILFRNYRG